MVLLCPENTVKLSASQTPGSNVFLSSLPQWSLSLRDRCDVDVPFVSEYSTDICYLHFGKLWVSVLTGSGSGGEEV